LRLSVVIPVYNEINTLGEVLRAVCSVLTHVEKEIVIVDDYSTDGTREWLQANFPNGQQMGSVTGIDASGKLAIREDLGAATVVIRPLFHEHNKGKGGAIQSALAVVTGDVIVIQDADLEYDPHDWAPMYDLIAVRKIADVVYGSRFYGRPHRSLYFHHFIANKLISFAFSMLYNQTLTDVEVCYKMFTKDVRDSLSITCNDFGFEIEISAQVSRQRKWRIYELGISYFGRTYDEGKKINWKDGFKALWYLIKFRV
jgi:glycosyltransferase involved in cell wall biosynthesis